jgi:hypothetical protein
MKANEERIMTTDKEMWLVQIGMAGPQRAITGRVEMIKHVSKLVGHNVAKEEKNWHGILERDLEVGHKLYAYGRTGNGWKVEIIRGLGPDEHDPRHYYELGEFITKKVGGYTITQSAEFPDLVRELDGLEDINKIL